MSEKTVRRGATEVEGKLCQVKSSSYPELTASGPTLSYPELEISSGQPLDGNALPESAPPHARGAGAARAVPRPTRRAEAERRGLPISGIWRSYSVVGVPPNIMGVGPAYAIPAALAKAGIGKDDVGVYEINEAFASQASWSVKALGLGMDRVNPNGGAIALGHPLGCTGARQMATLLHELHRREGSGRRGSQYGVVSMCIGTGMGAAAVIEVPSTNISSRL